MKLSQRRRGEVGSLWEKWGFAIFVNKTSRWQRVLLIFFKKKGEKGLFFFKWHILSGFFSLFFPGIVVGEDRKSLGKLEGPRREDERGVCSHRLEHRPPFEGIIPP